MLVLSRKIGEEIVVQLGTHLVRVKVVEIRGQGTRLAIDAPPEVEVHRREVWDRLHSWHGHNRLDQAVASDPS